MKWRRPTQTESHTESEEGRFQFHASAAHHKTVTSASGPSELPRAVDAISQSPASDIPAITPNTKSRYMRGKANRYTSRESTRSLLPANSRLQPRVAHLRLQCTPSPLVGWQRRVPCRPQHVPCFAVSKHHPVVAQPGMSRRLRQPSSNHVGRNERSLLVGRNLTCVVWPTASFRAGSGCHRPPATPELPEPGRVLDRSG